MFKIIPYQHEYRDDTIYPAKGFIDADRFDECRHIIKRLQAQ